MESIGFKEWAMVCEALGGGGQSIILRKGGIAEGDGFSFQHREFFLFPTWFHEQPEKVRRSDIQISEPAADKIEVKYFARLEFARLISSWATAEALEPWHILRPEVVRERFDYDQAPGLHVGFVRMFRVFPVWTFPNEKNYGGCRSWVKLPESPGELHLEPILSDAEHEKRHEEVLKALGRRAAGSNGVME